MLASTLLNAKMRNGTLRSRGLNGQDTNRGSVPFGTGPMYVYTANQRKALSAICWQRLNLHLIQVFCCLFHADIFYVYSSFTKLKKTLCFCSKFRNDTVSIRFSLNAHVACMQHLCLDHNQNLNFSITIKCQC